MTTASPFSIAETKIKWEKVNDLEESGAKLIIWKELDSYKREAPLLMDTSDESYGRPNSFEEAKDLVEAAPSMVKEGIPEAEANEMKAKLEEAGAEVELK